MSEPLPSVGDGRFHLLQPIGRGGMATVFLARGPSGERCAVKVLTSPEVTERARARFLQEARATALLNHPNVVRVVEVGDAAPPYYIALELALGGTLAHRVRDLGALPAPEALAWTIQALAGLHHAHAAGVVHRDVKPHNMLLARDTDDRPWLDPGMLKLTDFGIAKFSGLTLGLTGADDALGTMAYMAPEQRADPRRAEPRSDLYGVGATLYLLLTRRRPIDLAMALREPSIYDRIPEPLRPLVQRATSRDPRDRYTSAREMAEAAAEHWAALDPDAPRDISARFA